MVDGDLMEPATAPRHDSPRIPPGDRGDIGTINTVIASVLGRVAGTGPPHLFTTLSRHPRLFRRWLRFAGGLMPGGRLPRRDTELLILRVAYNCDCAYEWDHHVKLGDKAGLTREDVDRVRQGPDAAGWSPRQAVLLRAADELHAGRDITDATWSRLRDHLDDRDLIELCLLVGHYEMLAMTINSLGIQPDGASR
jgi:alkylhydroperoxidase family enzyme